MPKDLIPRSLVKEALKSVKEKGNIYCSVKPGKDEKTPHAFVILRKALDAVDAIPAVEAEVKEWL